MKPGLALRVSQGLALTPQLQQAIKLLQLTTLELEHEVAQQLADNPFLERDDPTTIVVPVPDDSADYRHPHDQGYDPAASHDAAAEAQGALEWADEPHAAPDLPTWDSATRDTHGDTDPRPDHADVGDFDADFGSDAFAGAPHDHPNWPDEPGHAADAARLGDHDPAGHDTPDATDGSPDTRWDSPNSPHAAPADADPFATCASPRDLRQHLADQAAGLHLSEAEHAALQVLIESLDDDGLLPEALPDLLDALIGQHPDVDDELRAQWLHHLTVALRLLQSFDPTGVGARDTAESLTLQIQELKREYRLGHNGDLTEPPFDLASRLCQRPLAELARPDFKHLAHVTQASVPDLRAALALIARLTPHPGRAWNGQAAPTLVPDVRVRRRQHAGQRWLEVDLNDAAVPRLRVAEGDAQLLKRHRPRDADAAHALSQRLQEARAFVKNLAQRHDTLLRVARCIVQRQADYFWQGERAMRPLVLREVADELGLHESTISRITTGKLLQSEHGTVQLKHFFSSALDSDEGATSSTAVRALIRQLIAAENPAHPLSDSQLEGMLKAQGITCARRTVAKYREGLGIAVASERRQRA